MPAERTNKTNSPETLESVPDHGHPDRKRVLNVLAQRRYRQRRREKFAALEAQAASGTVALDSNSSEDSDVAIEVAQSHSVVDMSAFNFENEPFTLDFPQEYVLQSLRSPVPSTSSSPPLYFPEGVLLKLPIFSALRALSSVAIAYDLLAHIYDPTYLHVLPAYSPAVAGLPANLHPVSAQLTIPHHPLLDVLPWPSVREKLICMLSMPSVLRPPVAREESDEHSVVEVGVIKQGTAICQLVHDIDSMQDGGGFRVHGDPFTCELNEDAWEVGDAFYKNWWWCLDQKIISVSNRRRKERGLPRLKAVFVNRSHETQPRKII